MEIVYTTIVDGNNEGWHAQHGDSMGTGSAWRQHGSQSSAWRQHGDVRVSMETARQQSSAWRQQQQAAELSMETAWGCWVSMETALRKDRQGGISFSEENGKKKRREEFQALFAVCVCCYATAIFFIYLLPSLLLSYIST